MKEQVFKGKWWLPDESDKIPGTLYYTPGKNIMLELIGNFSSKPQDPFEQYMQKEDIAVIWGQVSTGERISLLLSKCAMDKSYATDYVIARYYAKVIVIGIHILSENDKLFFKAKVRIPELSVWCHPGLLERFELSNEKGQKCFGIRMFQSKDSERTEFSVTLPSKHRISIVKNAEYKSGHNQLNPSFSQFTELHIEKQNTSINDLYSKAIRFEEFLSLSLRKPVHYSQLLLFCKDEIKHYSGAGEVHYKPIQVDKVFHKIPTERKVNIWDFVFGYADVKQKLSAMLKKWYSRDAHFRAIRGNFLESIDYSGSFSHINFLIVVQALEGYIVRYYAEDAKKYDGSNKKGDPYLKACLKFLLDKFKDVKGINQKMNLDTINKTRNYYSHLHKRRKDKIADGVGLYQITEELERLLVCCVMDYLGFLPSEIDILARNTRNF